MAAWNPPLDDLVLSRLLDKPASKSLELATPSELAAYLLALRPGPDPRSIRHVLRRADSKAIEALRGALPDYAELVEGGVAAVLDLHATPDREVSFGDHVLLLRTHNIEGEVAVQTATWAVERSANRTVLDGGPLTIDEFGAPRDLIRLEGLLADWALKGRFVPEMPRMRVAAVATPAVVRDRSELDRSLRAMAAVHGARLDFYVADHDPTDTKEAASFERRLSGGGYHMMVTMSEPQEGWVWKLATRLKNSGLQFRPLSSTTTSDATAELASILSVAARSWPERPARFWDTDAVHRVDLLVCESFGITERARNHLVRNRYPDPERMLGHIEKLAACAHAWNELMHRDEMGAERFEDWAHREFSLAIALHDKGIDTKTSTFEFEGMELDGRPHVKVDDAVAPSECGRIYFAMDERRDEGVRRLIIDHVGLHDRS